MHSIYKHSVNWSVSNSTLASLPMTSKNSPMPSTDHLMAQAVIMWFMLAIVHKAPALLILRSGLGNVLKHNLQTMRVNWVYYPLIFLFSFLCMSVCMVIYVQVHVFSCEYMYTCKGMFKYLQMHVYVQVYGYVCVNAKACMCMCACEGQRTASAVLCLFFLFIFFFGRNSDQPRTQ